MQATSRTYSAFEYEKYKKKLKEKNIIIPKIIISASAQAVGMSEEEKIIFFLNKCKDSKFRASTSKKYLELFKKINNIRSKKVQMEYSAFPPSAPRYITTDQMELLLQQFLETQNLLMLFCFYTGLRSMEIAQFSTQHLNDILLKKEFTPLVLKGGKKFWRILYTRELLDLANILAEQKAEELDYYRRTNTDILIWQYSPLYISILFKNEFIKCFKRLPPKGFGLHNIRYYWATKNSKNLPFAQLKLNHSTIKTTKRYIKYDAEKIDFNTLNNTEFYKSIL